MFAPMRPTPTIATLNSDGAISTQSVPEKREAGGVMAQCAGIVIHGLVAWIAQRRLEVKRRGLLIIAIRELGETEEGFQRRDVGKSFNAFLQDLASLLEFLKVAQRTPKLDVESGAILARQRIHTERDDFFV